MRGLRFLRDFHGKENQGHAPAVLVLSYLDELELPGSTNRPRGMNFRQDARAHACLAHRRMEHCFLIASLRLIRDASAPSGAVETRPLNRLIAGKTNQAGATLQRQHA